MKKQRLDLDSIEVESFVTDSAVSGAQGTVLGYATEKAGCQPNTNDVACGSAIDACSGDSACHMACPGETFYCEATGGVLTPQ